MVDRVAALLIEQQSGLEQLPSGMFDKQSGQRSVTPWGHRVSQSDGHPQRLGGQFLKR